MSSIVWKREVTEDDPEAAAVEVASRGAPQGTVIGRTTAEALAFSVILRPKSGLELGLLGPIAAFSASEGIRKDTGIITWIRWPQEVVADKAVLATTSVSREIAGGSSWVVLNFHLNRGLPKAPGATSLDELLGVDVETDMLTSKVLDSLAWMHSGWDKQMFPQILPRISSMLENSGEMVVVKGRRPGVVKGVDRRGRLVVELDGSMRVLAVARKSQLAGP